MITTYHAKYFAHDLAAELGGDSRSAGECYDED
jgi:hypothetical protein